MEPLGKHPVAPISIQRSVCPQQGRAQIRRPGSKTTWLGLPDVHHPPFKRNDGIQGGDRVECWLAAIGENKASSVRFSWLDCFRHQDRRTCQLKRSGLLVYSKMALMGVHLTEYGSVDRFLDKTHQFL